MPGIKVWAMKVGPLSPHARAVFLLFIYLFFAIRQRRAPLFARTQHYLVRLAAFRLMEASLELKLDIQSLYYPRSINETQVMGA